MGTIYRAWHLQLKHPVALKIIKQELVQYPELVGRFLQEARCGAQLHGPHTPRVLDAGEDDTGRPFFVMELLIGSDLGELLERQGRLPVHSALEYALQACAAIAEAHELGIVHRDLKPENLFLTAGNPLQPPLIKVLDFGVSKSVGDRHFTHTGQQNIGSPRYMAPEQVRAPALVDSRADIWSLGATLFELVSGRPAFDGPTLPAISAAILQEPPPKLRDALPAAPLLLENVVDKCLRKQLAARYQCIAELSEALELVRSIEIGA